MTRRAPLLCAVVFALFHVLTAVWTLLSTGGVGEGQMWTILILDYPLVVLLEALPGGGHILYNSTAAYTWFFSIAGTLMYAALGYCLGVLLRGSVAFIARRKQGASAI